MNDFLSFYKMFSTSFIKVIYVIGVLGVTLGGVFMMARNPPLGIAVLLLGNMLWRIICEGWIVLFSIHELLASIDKQLKSK